MMNNTPRELVTPPLDATTRLRAFECLASLADPIMRIGILTRRAERGLTDDDVVELLISSGRLRDRASHLEALLTGRLS